ncbi:universal stress protein [Lentzea sp. NPDC005914]|uniref:universal stress protein n=1 Tax=Lentzea sp. NPDC005914 TaxID=3154572 RepID=UPI0033F05B0D
MTDRSSAERRVRLPADRRARQGTPVLVVGFDDQAASVAALRTAADLARRLAADLHVVHCIDVRDYPIDPDTDAELWEDHARKALEHLHVKVGAALAEHQVRWTYHAWSGHPVTLLVTVADEQEALMIVVGTHRHRSLARMMRGSVSRGVARSAHRPVLLVSDPDDG